jgi:actin related protein 2/3 complex, subunit 2
LHVEDLDNLIKNIALIKRNALAAPFEKAFAAHADLHKASPTSLEGAHAAPTAGNTTADLAAIHYRDEEAIYISPASDRVTVIFSTVFREEVDHIFGEVFLREFVDARKRPALQNAPQVLFSNREAPLEIRHLPEIQKAASVSKGAGKGEIGYITFGTSLLAFLNFFFLPSMMLTRVL